MHWNLSKARTCLTWFFFSDFTWRKSEHWISGIRTKWSHADRLIVIMKWIVVTNWCQVTVKRDLCYIHILFHRNRLRASYNFVTSEDILLFGTEIRKYNPVLLETVNNCRPHSDTSVTMYETNALGWCLNEVTEWLRTNSQSRGILSTIKITKQGLLALFPTQIALKFCKSAVFMLPQFAIFIAWIVINSIISLFFLFPFPFQTSRTP